RHVIHNGEWRTEGRGWKTRARWGILRVSSSRGDRWGTASERASLRRLSSGRSRARRWKAQQSAVRRRYRDMPLARALVAGALVSAFLVPATAGFAQESSTTTTTSTTTPTTTTPVPPSTGAAPTTPKPDPDAFAALANQVSQ